MFKSVLAFEGRINRREYFLSFLIFFAGLSIIYSIVTGILESDIFINAYGVVVYLILSFLCAPFAFLFFAQGAKRCHDIGIGMWWQLVPFIGLLLILKKGDLTRNEYGSRPNRSGHRDDRDDRDTRDTRDNNNNHYSSTKQLENPYTETRSLLRKCKLDGIITEDEFNEKNPLLDIQEREFNEKKDLLVRKEVVDKIAKPLLDNLDKLVIDGIFTKAEYDEKKKELYNRLLNESHPSRRIQIANSYSKRIFYPFKK